VNITQDIKTGLVRANEKISANAQPLFYSIADISTNMESYVNFMKPLFHDSIHLLLKLGYTFGTLSSFLNLRNYIARTVSP
jgi:hypothetical protein